MEETQNTQQNIQNNTSPQKKEGVVDPERELDVKESIKIDDGMHTGTISRVEYRDEPYQYIDIFMKLDDVDIELKAGYPQNVSTNSALGKLLERFGIDIVSGTKINPYKVLTGKKVAFQTITENVKMNDGRSVPLARVIRESIKPAA